MPSPVVKYSKKNIRSAFDEIERIFKTAASPREMRELGEQAVQDVRKRTRLGYGVEEDGKARYKLQGLSSSYIEKRRRYKSRNILSDKTSASKSNLTLSGQMLDSLRVLKANTRSVEIGPFGNRKAFPPGSRAKRVGNKKVSDFVQAKGRVYLNLSDLEIKKLARYYQNQILKPKLAKV